MPTSDDGSKASSSYTQNKGYRPLVKKREIEDGSSVEEDCEKRKQAKSQYCSLDTYNCNSNCENSQIDKVLAEIQRKNSEHITRNHYIPPCSYLPVLWSRLCDYDRSDYIHEAMDLSDGQKSGDKTSVKKCNKVSKADVNCLNATNTGNATWHSNGQSRKPANPDEIRVAQKSVLTVTRKRSNSIGIFDFSHFLKQSAIKGVPSYEGSGQNKEVNGSPLELDKHRNKRERPLTMSILTGSPLPKGKYKAINDHFHKSVNQFSQSIPRAPTDLLYDFSVKATKFGILHGRNFMEASEASQNDILDCSTKQRTSIDEKSM